MWEGRRVHIRTELIAKENREEEGRSGSYPEILTKFLDLWHGNQSSFATAS
jgi:hypothetical protein